MKGRNLRQTPSLEAHQDFAAEVIGRVLLLLYKVFPDLADTRIGLRVAIGRLLDVRRRRRRGGDTHCCAAAAIAIFKWVENVFMRASSGPCASGSPSASPLESSKKARRYIVLSKENMGCPYEFS